MRFCISCQPKKSFSFSKGSWQQVSTLRMQHVQAIGLLISCVGMLLVALLLNGQFQPTNLWIAILIILVTIPLHELIHAIAMPGFGLSYRTIVCFPKNKNVFFPYVYYAGKQPVWRLLLTGFAPVFVLTILPIVFNQFFIINEKIRLYAGFLAFFNIAISGGDLFNLFWISTKIALQTSVRQNDWILFRKR